MSALADAVTFDHLVHLGLDLAAPTGPLPWPGPAMDELRSAPALDWMTTGLPQMCGAALAPVLTRPVEFRLEGPGGRAFVLAPSADDPVPVALFPVQAHPTAADTVTSSTEDFLSWATTRSPWRDAVRLDGDEAYLSQVLDLIDVV